MQEVNDLGSNVVELRTIKLRFEITDQLEISSWVPGACTGEPRLQCEIQQRSIVNLMSRNDLGYQDAQKEVAIEE